MPVRITSSVVCVLLRECMLLSYCSLLTQEVGLPHVA